MLMTTLTAGILTLRPHHLTSDYTSDNSMPEDTQDTDVRNIITAYTTDLSSVDGGLKARPEMCGIAVKQIINAVGNRMENLTKENVASQYVEKIMNVVSHKTLRNKLRSLEYYFVATLLMFCLLIQIQLFRSKLYKI